MSRIGKLQITIPESVTVVQEGNIVKVTGPLGELQTHILPVVSVVMTDGFLNVNRRNDSIQARSAHGLTRQLIANMVIGTTEGFVKRLELKGVGYRASTPSDNKITLNVGFSHPVEFDAPAHVTFKVEKNVIVITGIDKQVVGEIAAQIRKVRPPEPYKGKGIMYQGEHVRRKAGKAAKAGA